MFVLKVIGPKDGAPGNNAFHHDEKSPMRRLALTVFGRS
jgi:hypothetical protein